VFIRLFFRAVVTLCGRPADILRRRSWLVLVYNDGEFRLSIAGVRRAASLFLLAHATRGLRKERHAIIEPNAAGAAAEK
jgi:hypothetical protein